MPFNEDEPSDITRSCVDDQQVVIRRLAARRSDAVLMGQTQQEIKPLRTDLLADLHRSRMTVRSHPDIGIAGDRRTPRFANQVYALGVVQAARNDVTRDD